MNALVSAQGMPFSESLVISVVGFGIVFFVLVVLMFVIKLLRSVLEGGPALPAAAAPAPVPAAAPSGPPAGMVPAKGSQGEIKLYDVDDRTAALIMAIVADELKAPLNELRFLSIREQQ